MKMNSHRTIGRNDVLSRSSLETPRPGGRSSAARTSPRIMVFVLIALLFQALIAKSAAQESRGQWAADNRLGHINTYGSIRHSDLYTEQRSRGSDVYRGPSGEVVHTRLPQGAKRITVNGRSYYRRGDTFYYRHYFEGSYVYAEGPPPIGLTVIKLPGTYSIQTHHGTRYHVSGDVYYVKETRGYRVVQPPNK